MRPRSLAHNPAAPSAIDRYIAVTAIATPAHLALYTLVLMMTTWPAVGANLICATLISIPSFFACRRWVWSSTNNTWFRDEALPYWLSTVANVVLASLAVHALSVEDLPRWALSVVPTLVYGVTWLARFFLLDRVVFRHREPAVDQG